MRQIKGQRKPEPSLSASIPTEKNLGYKVTREPGRRGEKGGLVSNEKTRQQRQNIGAKHTKKKPVTAALEPTTKGLFSHCSLHCTFSEIFPDVKTLAGHVCRDGSPFFSPHKMLLQVGRLESEQTTFKVHKSRPSVNSWPVGRHRVHLCVVRQLAK